MLGKPTILLDLDGVIFDTHTALRDSVSLRAEESNIVHQFPEEITDWHITTDCIDTNVFIQDAFRDEKFFYNLQPYEGAVVAVKKLMQKANVYFCSSPYISNEMSYSGKAASVKKFFGTRGLDKLILTNDKTAINGDILVDDRPEILGAFDPRWERVVYDHPYNKTTAGLRITGWSEDSVDLILTWAKFAQARNQSVRRELAADSLT